MRSAKVFRYAILNFQRVMQTKVPDTYFFLPAIWQAGSSVLGVTVPDEMARRRSRPGP